MGGMVNSAGGLLGLSSGPQAPAAQTGNSGLDALNAQNSINAGGDNNSANEAQSDLLQFSNGGMSGNDAQNAFFNQTHNDPNAAALNAGFNNQLATGATTGTQYAAQQMNANPTQSSLYGSNGQLGNTENAINQEQSQGFNLTPGDNSLYGQESGQIANQFAQQGNQAAQSLASRGLSNSGAAGATFSGIAGNQNQMLANAQQQIAQQRFSNTQQQISQNQSYAAQLGGQYNSALQQQYGRQLSGAQEETGNQAAAAGTQNSANSQDNSANMAVANANVANTPTNLMDAAGAGAMGMISNPVGMFSGTNNSAQKTPSSGAATQTGNTVTAASTSDDPAMYSDERLKTNVVDASIAIEDMLDNLSPYSYEYNNKDLPQGVKYGILAQDLANTPAGKTAVVEKELGKAIDLPSAVSLILASLANINHRLSKLEA